MSNHKFEELKRRIMALSRSDTWLAARLEWKLDRVEFLEDGDHETCACTHTPIKELCFLLNTLNGNELMVGNVCVNQFMGIDSEGIFASLRRIRENPSRSPSDALVVYAFEHRLITEWELRFARSTHGKRKLSQRQEDKRLEVNNRLLRNLGRSHGA